MKALFLLFAFSGAVLFEFYWSQLLLPPLLALSLLTLYFSFSISGTAVFLPALLAGVILDLGFNRPYPLSGIILLLALLAARLIRRKSPLQVLETALAGLGAVSVVILGGTAASALMANTSPDPWEIVWRLLFWGVLALAATPVLTLTLDGIGHLLGIQGAIREQKSPVGSRLRPRKVKEQTGEKA